MKLQLILETINAQAINKQVGYIIDRTMKYVQQEYNKNKDFYEEDEIDQHIISQDNNENFWTYLRLQFRTSFGVDIVIYANSKHKEQLNSSNAYVTQEEKRIIYINKTMIYKGGDNSKYNIETAEGLRNVQDVLVHELTHLNQYNQRSEIIPTYKGKNYRYHEDREEILAFVNGNFPKLKQQMGEHFDAKTFMKVMNVFFEELANVKGNNEYTKKYTLDQKELTLDDIISPKSRRRYCKIMYKALVNDKGDSFVHHYKVGDSVLFYGSDDLQRIRPSTVTIEDIDGDKVTVSDSYDSFVVSKYEIAPDHYKNNDQEKLRHNDIYF